jgi:hypothetical protein
MTSTHELNGNWSDIQRELDRRAPSMRGHGALAERWTTANARAAETAFFERPAAATGPATRGGTVVRSFWWGFHIQVSHEDLPIFLDAAEPINAVIGAIGGAIPTPAAPFIKIAAVFIAGALRLLRELDQGRGVYISMSWFAAGAFVPTTV